MIYRALALLFLLSGLVLGGTTGKIAGQISDADTGEPLIGVNILLEGTTLGASTDVDGIFVILNIPPGVYNVQFSYLGYKTLVVRDVRVNVDFTTRLDQKLGQAIVEGEIVEVFGEKNPLVRQDLTNTQVAVTSEQISELPVDQIRDVIALQAGVVEDNDGSLHIRGGRSNEIAFQVNGVGINNPFGSNQGVGLATNAVEEVSVSAGTFSAEYGNALSGVVNFVTKDGPTRYTGSLRAWSGDHLSSRKEVFFNIDEVDMLNNARGEFTFGGPVPGFGSKLTFFGSGVYQKNDGYLYGIRVYNPEDLLLINGTNYSVDPFGLSFGRDELGRVVATVDPNRAGASGDGEIVPMVTSRSLNLSGKLTWKPTNQMKVTYDIIFDDGERYSSASTIFRRYRFNPDGRPKTVSNNYSNALGLTHTLTKNLFYSMKLAANYNFARTAVFDDPYDPRYVPVPDNNLTNLLLAETGFIVGSTNLDRTTEKARSLSGKLDVVYQAHPSHELKFGGEAALHRLDLDDYTLFFDVNESRFVVPTAEINPRFQTFQRYIREPVQGALYVLDKMELSEKFILNAGLRYEYLNTYADYNPDIATTYDEGGRASDGNRLQSAEAKHRISPRVSLSFPITSEGIIRFSYGIFYQNPTFRNIYRNPRFLDLDRFAAGTPSFGNANLNPQKSIQYELGLQQQFTEDLKIDLTVFYKDVNDLIQTRRVSLGESVTRQFDLITNISYANVKGFTVALLKRRSNTGLFSGTIDYTYQIGEGAYDDPVALTINTNSGRQNPQKLVPLDFDRTHTINATVTLSKANNFSASMIGTLRGGTPYTPVVPNEFQTVSFEINSERRPVQYNVNLKAEKFFKTGFGKFSVFAFVENLFDFQTERFVHENTGRSLSNLEEVTNPGLFDNLRRDLANDPQDYFPVRFLDDYYQREDWLGAPREVRFGLSYSF